MLDKIAIIMIEDYVIDNYGYDYTDDDIKDAIIDLTFDREHFTDRQLHEMVEQFRAA